MYVCEDMLGMLKLMLGAIVLHHARVTPLLGAAHRPREARGTFKVNNPYPTRRATSPRDPSAEAERETNVEAALILMNQAKKAARARTCRQCGLGARLDLFRLKQ